MTRTRSEIAKAAAEHLASLSLRSPASVARGALVGFDGFVDSIIHVVDKRMRMVADGYERMRTIEQFAARVGSAAGKSTNIELVVHEDRFGGNGPLLAGTLGRLGLPTTYIGAVGREDDPAVLHPLYKELERRCTRVIPVAPPAHTDALEFDDGKLMLGKPQNIQTITWDMLCRTVGLPRLREMIGQSRLVSVVNWVMMGGVESIWEGLASEVLPKLAERPRIFLDLCDPAKRTDADIARALAQIQTLQRAAPVTLGLNLAESERLGAVLKLPASADRDMSTLGETVRAAARALQVALGLDTVVVHRREGAGAANAAGDSAWFEGPFTRTPRISTGAGDHFNGGFAFAQVLGLPLDECLAVGCTVSGAYVRDAQSPDAARLQEFLRRLPNPER